jgi:EmrB/QacA subfamily drug resistance transporter
VQIKSVVSVQYVICLGAFLSNLSAGMFNIALADIAGEFHRSVASAQWVVTAYLLVISVCLPLMGSIGDMKGKRNIHNLGLLIFMLGGLGCALSSNLAALIGFRIVQGIGASMYQANNMALIVSLFPAEKRGRALGTVSTFVAAGAIIGPSLGGFMIQWLSWRANFGLLAVFALGAWLLAQRMIPRDGNVEKAAPDITGAALFAITLTALVTGLQLGTVWGWTSGAVGLLLGIFGLFAVGFARWSLSARWAATGKNPFIRLAVFNHPFIVFGILLTVVTYSAAFATQLVLPFLLRNAMGLEPGAAGLVVMAYPLSLIVAAPLGGGSSDKFGQAPVIMLGLGSMTVSLASLAFLSPVSHLAYVIAFVVLLGLSMGMITAPNNSIVMSRTAKQALGMMSSMIALCRNLGMMLGAGFGGVLLGRAAAATDPRGAARAIVVHFRELYIALAAMIALSLLIFLWIVSRSGRKAAPMVPDSRTGRKRESVV